jgi:prepilin-type N-terminal cleavage/methylation domain-containing protein
VTALRVGAAATAPGNTPFVPWKRGLQWLGAVVPHGPLLAAPAIVRAPSVQPRSTQRGFTLIEMAVVMAIIGLMATAAIAVVRAQRRNVHLRQASSELAMRTIGLRTTALAEGRNYLLVVVDAPGNDASSCSWKATGGCSRYFILSAPKTDWKLTDFDPASPGANASVSDIVILPPGARFYLQSGGYSPPPPPFSGVPVFDPQFLAKCAGGGDHNCFAILFTMNGVTLPMLASGGAQQPPPTGLAFLLGSDAELEGQGGDHRGVVIGFPTGVVKTWAY